MKITLNLVGVLMVLMGAIWFLQGINVLPGSFMTGQIRWAYYGSIAAFAGLVLIVAANRSRHAVRRR
jgi:bacteriorhodopsin